MLKLSTERFDQYGKPLILNEKGEVCSLTAKLFNGGWKPIILEGKNEHVHPLFTGHRDTYPLSAINCTVQTMYWDALRALENGYQVDNNFDILPKEE